MKDLSMTRQGGGVAAFIDGAFRNPALRLAVALAFLALLAAHAVVSLPRPMWLDEAMAMANYPLGNLLDVFDPLPFYVQAAPPLFSLVTEAGSYLPLLLFRAILFWAILAGMIGAFSRVYPVWVATVSVAVIMLCGSFLIGQISEFKYYGFDMLGAALAICWALAREQDTPFRGRDVAVLGLAMVLGIATLVIAVVVSGTVMADRAIRTRRMPRGGELLWAGVFLCLAAGYYLAIGHATQLQTQAFPDVYQREGLQAVSAFIGNSLELVRAQKWSMPLLVIAWVVTILDFGARRSRNLTLVTAAVFLGFCALSFLGKYPVFDQRHVAWTAPFHMAVVANALVILSAPGISMRVGTLAKVLLIAALVPAILPSTKKLLAGPPAYARADNHLAMQWLRDHDPVPVGLWLGGQALLDAYLPHVPELAKHTYLNRFDARSASHTLTPMTELPLLSRIPRDQTVYIFSSHLGLTPLNRQESERLDALLRPLDEAQCIYAPEVSGVSVFILQVNCPPA